MEKINVANVKCGGCAATISDGLAGITGVASVDVDVATGEVTVSGEGVERTQLAAKLAELGFPEREQGV